MSERIAGPPGPENFRAALVHYRSGASGKSGDPLARGVDGAGLTSGHRAYAFARPAFPAGTTCSSGYLCALLLTGIVLVIPAIPAHRRSGGRTDYQGLISISGIGHRIFLLRQFFRSLPVNLEGCGRDWRVRESGRFFCGSSCLPRGPRRMLGLARGSPDQEELCGPLRRQRARARLQVPLSWHREPAGHVRLNWGRSKWATACAVNRWIVLYFIAQRWSFAGSRDGDRKLFPTECARPIANPRPIAAPAMPRLRPPHRHRDVGSGSGRSPFRRRAIRTA